MIAPDNCSVNSQTLRPAVGPLRSSGRVRTGAGSLIGQSPPVTMTQKTPGFRRTTFSLRGFVIRQIRPIRRNNCSDGGKSAIGFEPCRCSMAAGAQRSTVKAMLFGSTASARWWKRWRNISLSAMPKIQTSQRAVKTDIVVGGRGLSGASTFFQRTGWFPDNAARLAQRGMISRGLSQASLKIPTMA